MAAPTPAFIQLQVDSSNAGKKVRVQSRVVGADTVAEHFFIPISPRSKLGVYFNSSGVLSIAASAHTSLQGFWWLINPVGSAVKIALRRLEFKYSAIAAAAANTRITTERITFTGAASALITAVKRATVDVNPVGQVLSATTGLTPSTVSANAPAYTSWAPTIITAAGILVPVEDEWIPSDEDGMAILVAGEGLVVRQPDAGVASDPRKLSVTVAWEEFE
jgi:hypothetical protein